MRAKGVQGGGATVEKQLSKLKTKGEGETNKGSTHTTLRSDLVGWDAKSGGEDLQAIRGNPIYKIGGGPEAWRNERNSGLKAQQFEKDSQKKFSAPKKREKHI